MFDLQHETAQPIRLRLQSPVIRFGGEPGIARPVVQAAMIESFRIVRKFSPT